MTAIFLPLSLSRASSAQTMPCWSSRPQVRNASHSLRSVTLGLVADGVMKRTPFSAYTSEAGILTPELKWPTTNLTPSPTNLFATETPCLGSETSSPCSTVIFWPLMPPVLLKSSAAWLTPCTNCAPNEAFGPVTGPATPILMSAFAAPAKAKPAASNKPDNPYLIIRPSLGFGAHDAPRRNDIPPFWGIKPVFEVVSP